MGLIAGFITGGTDSSWLECDRCARRALVLLRDWRRLDLADYPEARIPVHETKTRFVCCSQECAALILGDYLPGTMIVLPGPDRLVVKPRLLFSLAGRPGSAR